MIDQKGGAVVLLAGKIVQVAVVFASIKCYTTFLSVKEIGNLYLVLAIVSYFGLSFINPIGMYVNRNLHRWKNDNTISDHFFIHNIYIVIISLLSVAVAYLIHSVFDIGNNIDSLFFAISIALYIYTNTWNNTIIPTLNMFYRRKSFVIFTNLTLLLCLGSSMAFIFIYEKSALAWLAGQIAGFGGMAIISLLYFKNAYKSDTIVFHKIFSYFSASSAKKVALFAIPLSIATIFMWVQTQGYKIMVEKFSGAEALGFIGVGFMIASSIAATAETLIQQIFYPAYYSCISDATLAERQKAWHTLSSESIGSYILLTIFVTFVAPFIITVLSPSKFFDAYIFISIGIWAELFRMCTNILSSVAHAELKTTVLTLPYAVGGAITMLFVYIAISFSSLLGIAYAIVLGGAVTLAVMLWRIGGRYKISTDIHRIKNSLFLSIPFLGAIFLYPYKQNFLVAIIVIGFFGIYLAIVEYILIKRGASWSRH